VTLKLAKQLLLKRGYLSFSIGNYNKVINVS
jgi:hypothetical protein